MTPLVLVHGFMGGAAQWDGYLDRIADTREIIAVDLPGFGAQAHLSAFDSIAGYADWVIGFLRQIGIARYDLLGHSMGGMIAQEIARRDQGAVDRLVLYATGSVGVLPGRFETIDESKQRAEQDGATATARRIAATWFLEREQASGFAQCAAVAERSPITSIRAGLDAMQGWSGRDRLGEISQNTLILWGDRDRTYPWEQINTLWRDIPETSLAVVPGCAHAVHAEKPDLFQAILADFLSSV